MADKYKLLKRYWGYDAFRPMQEPIIDSLLAGHDTLALLPTGGGKSLCYQLPALMLDGTCLVVSPLVALMKDQVQKLNEKKIHAACIVSGMSSSETTDILYNAIAGKVKLLYVSPERLRQQFFREHLKKIHISLIAVDEAHCISQWGYDFRPPYLQIADIRTLHPHAPIVALTATATQAVAEDIKRLLMMADCREVRSSFARPNIAYSVIHDADKALRLLRLVQGSDGSSIVYVRSRKQTQLLAQYLTDNGVPALHYHAGLTAAERDLRQKQWMTGKQKVIVATNAFGMGIDKSDVRMVVHMDMPDSIEAYFQEAGRAGRDGKPAKAILLHDSTDTEKCERNFLADYPTATFLRNTYRALCNYYKIPTGGGGDTRFDIDIDDICNYYRMRPREFYSACRLLERQGLIRIPEQENLASTVHIRMNKEELYRFQVNHFALGNMLQQLIREYAGIFTQPTPINEQKFASKCFLDAKDVKNMLSKMHAMHVLEYVPQPTKPQIYFLSPRIDEREILLSDTEYTLTKRAARHRLDAMEAYVANDSTCRSVQLLAYFGENGSADCGTCDVCRHRSTPFTGSREAILQTLGKNSLGVNELVREMEAKGCHDSKQIIRELLDEGIVQLDADLRLALA